MNRNSAIIGDTGSLRGVSIPDLGEANQEVGRKSDVGAQPVPALRAARRSVLSYTFRSLADRNFLRLWLGTLFMISGFQMQAIAQGYLVYEMTGSAKILGLVSTAGALPLLALAPFTGAIADRVERRLLVQASQAFAAFVAVAVAVSIVTGKVTWVHLMAASMAQGAMIAFMAPARQAIIPQLVGRENISNAMALNAAVMGAAALAAPAVAGLLYSSIGPQGVYFLVVASGLAAVGFTGTIHLGPRTTRRAMAPVLADVAAGLSYIRGNGLVKLHLAVALTAVLLAMPLTSLLPVFVVDVYHRESGAFGLLISMIGLGSLAGSLVIAGMSDRRRGRVVIGGGFLAGGALVLVGLAPSYLVAVPIMAIFGLGLSGNINLNQALLMEKVDDRYRGRVMSILIMTFGLTPLGVLPAALAVDVVGAQLVVGFMGVAMMAAAAVFLTQKRLRRLQ